MHVVRRVWLPTVLAMTMGCTGSCGAEDRKAMGQALAAYDCAPDVGVCIGGEAYLSVGQVQATGEPCRQQSLGLCERGCVDEGIPIAYVGKEPSAVRAQLCAPERGTVLAAPTATGSCPTGEILCKDGVVQICGKQAARCERGCATDDVIDDEPTLTLERATQLLCVR